MASGNKGERQCPLCGKPSAAGFAPFCSRGCKAIDLNRWLSGGYVIAGTEDDALSGEMPDVPLAPDRG